MPRRSDLKKILIIGSGPIVIGQGCEFDYSGTQACKALREEGYHVVLVNSNPATIMTDPEMADTTYIEPLTVETLTRIIEIERPDAILPTLGGQTGLNLAVRLSDAGTLARFGVEMIGANRQAIGKAEGREEFKDAMRRIGLDMPRSALAHDMDEARRVVQEIGLPAVIRPGFTLGGTGGGIAYNVDEFEEICRRGLDLSLNGEVLIEESIAGWKEFELEVMRDRRDNVVIVCGIENFDPMGVHTGDSITVAPIQTLTDKEYQVMRDAAIRVIREIGVETGGSNIQFAVEPTTGRMTVIEMNPRVSRSSALASKATGFPIAKIAAKLAVGYTLDEIRNDITKETPACFEPVIDYCVVKIPRWTFEKFPSADTTLTTQMKSVGEVMAIGRTFKEAFQKAMRSLETGRSGFGNQPGASPADKEPPTRDEILGHLVTPRPDRVDWIRTALRSGMTVEEVAAATRIDPWFLDQLQDLVVFEDVLVAEGAKGLDRFAPDVLRESKRLGYSDRQIAHVVGTDEWAVRERRKSLGITPVYKLVDTCAAEFEAYTPYYYSTYEDEDETRVSEKKRIIILGGGPNRIGQGIEFDYCCCHASFALRELGYESVMINSNPETVSTDFDTSDMLFFEPLTHEDVLNVCDRLAPTGVIVQFGGQTPLNLARGLHEAGVPLIGTPVDSIDRAEDRERFQQMIQKLGLRQPDSGMARSPEEAVAIAKRIGFPALIRPSYVLGGRGMEIVYDEHALVVYVKNAVANTSPDRPILVDKFIEDALEVDVDAVSDGETVVIGGIMEHIEEAGIHSGDSCCSIPTYTMSEYLVEEIRRQTFALAKELGVIGLMNIQFAVRGSQIYVLEVNPRASRTSPFVSKAIGVPLAKMAAKTMVGVKLTELGFTKEVVPTHFSLKAPVFPFNKFPGVDTILGPEMRSTGEVMGIDYSFGPAFAKALLAAGVDLPKEGNVFVSVRDEDKRTMATLATRLAAMGYHLVATSGTHKALRNHGIAVERINKVHEGRPHVIDLIKNREIHLILNTPSGRLERSDDRQIRAQAVLYKIPCITNIAGAAAAIQALESSRNREPTVKSLQKYHTAE